MSLRNVVLALVVASLAACQSMSSPPPTAPTASSATEHAARVAHMQLPNGLRVFVMEDHRAPVVVSQVWYKVGSADEPKGLGGISHVVEHMMFDGTQRIGPGQFSKIIAENGGRENAFTAQDYTVYFQELAASRLPIALDLEADRMQNLNITDQQFNKEIKVVMEERRMRTDDNPDALTDEKFNYEAYGNYPYGHPVIGWMRDLRKFNAGDVRAWYKRWYAPNNAILVVVGDVKPDAVFALAKKYFGPIPARPIDRPPPPPAPDQAEPRMAFVRAPAELPYIVFGFHTPRLRSPDFTDAYALDVASGVLDGGQSSRFARDLIRGRQIAVSADADYSGIGRFAPMFTLDAVPAAGYNVMQVQQAMIRELERLKREPVGAAELERVKAQVAASQVYQRDSVFGQAMMIGMLETVGLPWQLMDDYAEHIKAVTPAQVQAVARKYFRTAAMTTVELRPLPIKGPRPPITPNSEQRHVR